MSWLLLKSLYAKREEGTWDRSFGMKDEAVGYITGDAEVPFLEPDEPIVEAPSG